MKTHQKTKLKAMEQGLYKAYQLIARANSIVIAVETALREIRQAKIKPRGKGGASKG